MAYPVMTEAEALPHDEGQEAHVRAIARELWEEVQRGRPGVFNREYWQGRLLEWAMGEESFRVDLFRLIDVLPSLHSNREVAEHVREYLMREGRELPAMLELAVKSAAGGVTGVLAAEVFKKNVRDMGRQFIPGETVAEALPLLRKQWKQGFAATVDLLGEATLSEAEADAYALRYRELIGALRQEVQHWPDSGDPHHKANVSLKVSALAPGLDPVDVAGNVSRLVARVRPLLRHAREQEVFINFDLEQWELHETTYRLFEMLARDSEFRDWPHLGIVVQAYLRSAREDAERLRALAQSRGAPLTVRLVKGAYWDYEVVRARQHGYEYPVFTDKAATDANFEWLSGYLLEHHELLRPAFGSHNLRSIASALAQADARNVPKSAIEFQTLYGMAEPERQALRKRGLRVRVYTPLGALIPGMAYLVRRLLENTANTSFLRLSHHERTDFDTLIAPPVPEEPEADARPFPVEDTGLDGAFSNCPLLDFTRAPERAALEEQIASWLGKFPIEVTPVINGEAAPGGHALEQRCSSDSRLAITHIQGATDGEAEAAIASAANAYPRWRDSPLRERAELLRRLGMVLQRDRLELAALETWEVGKPWADADADVAEAIDFCRYYARQALEELTPRPLLDAAGEANELRYEGRGVAVVIAPWNFPLAILCGMTTAALVAGNAVVMKPAEQSSAVGAALHARMLEAGFPPDVAHFLPGAGESLGPLLVEHPAVAVIAFTGSKAVGLDIARRAAVVAPGQREMKHLICEMGGKNAIIVDEDADLDEAVAGVIKSAFGYAGQKCSACSRLLLVGATYEPFLRRLVEAVKRLRIAPATEPGCDIPPVVDGEAHQRLLRWIDGGSAPEEAGAASAALAEADFADVPPAHQRESENDGSAPGNAGVQRIYVGDAREGGYFVPPVIFAVRDPSHPLLHEELFGPILTVFHVETFEAALEAAMATEFRLTGGVYSRLPSHLELARDRFRAGNLYLNRAITGAIVGRQPFGGSGMSGAGTKAGGPGYLLHFADPRVVTENTMRRGFTPELGG